MEQAQIRNSTMEQQGTSSAPVRFKVVLLGEGAVGKTSLLLRFIENKFSSKHASTLQASFMRKKISVGGQTVDMDIWDTAGQEQFHALGPIYYRNSSGAILVFDITDAQSFSKVKTWVKELRRMLPNRVQIIIVGNKSDLQNQRQVPIDEAQTYASQVKAIYLEASAKTNENIEAVFVGVAKGC